MPLTPATQKFFEKLKSSPSNQKPLWEMSEQEFLSARDGIEKEFRNLAAAPDSLAKIEEIYLDRGADKRKIQVQMITPSTVKEPAPTIIYFPGNGFVFDLNMHQTPCSIIAQQTGCKVFIVNTALAPEHKYPEGLQDALDATTQIYAQAEKYGIDKEKFAIGGDSSGGNFAALTAIKIRDKFPHIKLAFQLLISPNVDETLDTYEKTMFKCYQDQDLMITPQGVKYFRDLYLPSTVNPASPEVSPLFANLEGLPPTILSYGEYDGVRGDSEAYFNKLMKSGNNATKVMWPGQTHNAMICRGVFNDGINPAEAIAESINKHLSLSQEKQQEKKLGTLAVLGCNS